MDVLELTAGNRKAVISPRGNGTFSVWVGYVLPCGAHVGALWFRGHTTCGAEYKDHGRAVEAAREFVNKRRNP